MSVRKLLAALSAAITLLGVVAVLDAPVQASPDPRTRATGEATEFVVLAKDSASTAAARAAVEQAGGTVLEENAAVRSLVVSAPADGFLEIMARNGAVAGTARNRSIGTDGGETPVADAVEQEGRRAPRSSSAARRPATTPGADTYETLQWDMEMIGAGAARAVNPGSRKVLVGVIDTGIDASHPDIAPNFNSKLSRNFTEDMPDIDGECEYEGCKDPANVDDGGHGTHVAGTIAAAANGYGVVGVAPNVQLVNLRAGQDSGYFFLGPVLDALTFAADNGVDVVNMSFYVDPWLFNCGHNPADSSIAQLEQRTIVSAMNRALAYASKQGVTLVSAMGNGNSDLGKPTVDASSPDYPDGAAYEREIDNSDCLVMPTEGTNVLNVTSVGPSKAKADYSDYGVERGWVAAPGGWFRDGYGTDSFRTDANTVLSAYPLKALQDEGAVDEDGNILEEAETYVFKECDKKGRCGYFTYLQGTSMAAPHAAGVVALAVSRYGKADRRGGLTLDPKRAAKIVADTATETPCPTPRLKTYELEGRDASYDAFCEGPRNFNGFYGHGIVNAYEVVAGRRR